MAVFKVETKNKVDIDKKPRVYFTCHPDDFEKYFKKVCDDIFKTHDCAIYYTEDMSEVIADDEKQVDLGRNNLFVIPVTFKLLTTPNRAMDEDIPYALKEHIPVLPIMMEPGIDEFYSKPDKFGELQYLNPYTTDLTEISYEEKLKKYLESVLISDDLAKRVRAAFDAYIFLSYRKKDRKYANELMRLIHSNPECRDIAIWFDEFLTPGESFKENIEKILDDCKLFTLLVTPQLLEKVVDENGEERDNYVISTELPLARKKKQEKGTDIFAVEMEKTDREALSSISIEDYTNPENADFRARLLETISRIAVTTNNTPEHNFLIGLAYLEGIDVEVDRERAVELIKSAADADLPEAMAKLLDIYNLKLHNYRQAALWAERLLNFRTTHLGEEHEDTLEALNNLGSMHYFLGEYSKGLDLIEKTYKTSCRVLGEEHKFTLVALNNLINFNIEQGNYDYALELAQKLYCVHKKCGNPPFSILNARSLISKTLFYKKEYERATEIDKEIFEQSIQCRGEEHADTVSAMLALALDYCELGKHEDSIALGEKAYKLRLKTYGEEHPVTLSAMSILATTYSEAANHEKALELKEQVYLLRCRILGEDHPDTLTILNNLSITHSELGNFEKAYELSKIVYDKRLKIFGQSHPATKRAEQNWLLASLELDTHKKKAAQRKYESLCHSLGEDHLDTLSALYDLVYVYYSSGDTIKAIELLEKLHASYCTVCGEESFETIFAIGNLAIMYDSIHNTKKALELKETALSLALKVYGEESPETVKLMAQLASTCGAAGDFRRQVELNERSYNLRCKIFGKSHPATINCLCNLAISYGNLGNHPKELDLLEKVYELRCEVLGECHEDTLTTLYSIALTYGDLCQYKKKLELLERLHSNYCRIFGLKSAKALRTQDEIDKTKELIEAS